MNRKPNLYREKARERLLSEKGIYHRARRCIEPEAVFAQIKHNAGWNRFRLRGMEKINVEFTLVAIVHNLRKMAKKTFSYTQKREKQQEHMKIKKDRVQYRVIYQKIKTAA